ncbi:MAG TPA: methionine--tRNA ligase subunit beta, partial [Clostridiales bacterium]|nr:methionine--tRNA ligase subunit beta [Clostridiales bacterium]
EENHVVYVWIDALSNYITGLEYDVDGEHGENFSKYWPADLHLIGKDILRFHTIYWPIMLMALEVPLPKQIFGHPWLLQGGGKMSKSKGNVLYAEDLVDLFGVDAVRYFVLHEMPFDNDGIITYELMVERINSELANTLGNLVNRTISMSNKYFDGLVVNANINEDVDEDLKRVVTETYSKVLAKMDKLRVSDAITLIFNMFKRCNKYIDETMPWVLAKDEEKKDRLATVLYNLIEGISVGANLLEPFMPETSKKILKQINGAERTKEQLEQFGVYPSETKVTDKPEILFARLDIKEVLEKIETTCEDIDSSNEEAVETDAAVIAIPDKDEISFDDFMSMQFQIGEVISCEEVKKSRKLLCSQVKVGNKTMQIVSGIKADYTPEEMVGKKVMVLVNLKPAKLAGLLSEGMLLCAEDQDGKLALMVAEKDMPSGAEIT